jgi:hypothetical protein
MSNRAWRKRAAEVEIRVVRDLDAHSGRGFVKGFLDDGGQCADERALVVDLAMGQPCNLRAVTGGTRTSTFVTRLSTGMSCGEGRRALNGRRA